MKRSVLNLYRNNENDLHAIFKNNHGRLIYLAIAINDNVCIIKECHYLDRSTYSVPKKAVTKTFAKDDLLQVIRTELDKDFIVFEYWDTILSKEQLIALEFKNKKPNILILLKDGNVLKTIFKNKFHRAIFLEITLLDSQALISKCFYCDERAKGKQIVPYGLKTIHFESALNNTLDIMNNELEGGFTEILISAESTLKLDRPFCGSI